MRFRLVFASALFLLCSSAFAQDTLRIMTYNVGVFHKEPESSISSVVALVQESGADIVSLNEVDSSMIRTGNKDQIRIFAREAGNWGYHFSRALAFPGAAYGVGVSWKPQFKSILKYTVKLPKGNGAEVRALSVVEFDNFVVASTHLDFKDEASTIEQANIASAILKIDYGQSNKPVFLCGDFNFKPDSKLLDYLRESFDILTPPEPSFSAKQPDRCIDYICLLKNKARVQVLEAGVRKDLKSADLTKASDHLPVMVTVKLP